MEDKGTKLDLILRAKLSADLVDFCLESEQPTRQHLQNLKDELTNNALEMLCSVDYIDEVLRRDFVQSILRIRYLLSCLEIETITPKKD